MKYNIPIIVESFGIVEIEAESLEQAIIIANSELPTPFGLELIDDSYEVDYGGIPAHNPNSVIEEWEKLSRLM